MHRIDFAGAPKRRLVLFLWPLNGISACFSTSSVGFLNVVIFGVGLLLPFACGNIFFKKNSVLFTIF